MLWLSVLPKGAEVWVAEYDEPCVEMLHKLHRLVNFSTHQRDTFHHSAYMSVSTLGAVQIFRSFLFQRQTPHFITTLFMSVSIFV